MKIHFPVLQNIFYIKINLNVQKIFSKIIFNIRKSFLILIF